MLNSLIKRNVAADATLLLRIMRRVWSCLNIISIIDKYNKSCFMNIAPVGYLERFRVSTSPAQRTFQPQYRNNTSYTLAAVYHYHSDERTRNV